jgi:hypothetical protein
MGKYFAALAVLLVILVGVIYLRTDDQILAPGEEYTEIPRVPEERDLRFPAEEPPTELQPGEVPRPVEQPPLDAPVDRERDPLSLYQPDVDEPAEIQLPQARNDVPELHRGRPESPEPREHRLDETPELHPGRPDVPELREPRFEEAPELHRERPDVPDVPEVRVPDPPPPLDPREPWADQRVDAEEERPDDLLPYPWTGRVQENSPGFVEPNRLDPRQPTGNPILSDPLPTGPEAGFYDRQERR